MNDTLHSFSQYLISVFEKDKELSLLQYAYNKEVIENALEAYMAKHQEITSYTLNVKKEDIAARYMNKIKREEHMAFIVISFIFLGIFIGLPLLFTYGILQAIGTDPGPFLAFLIIETVTIFILAILTSTNLYWTGRTCRLIRKNGSILEMFCHINAGELDDPVIRIAYILHTKEFRYAYITEDGELCIAYFDDGIGRYYTTCAFKNLCSKDEPKALQIDSDGVCLVPAK